MIIGISGKKQAGKDTTSTIIQLVTEMYKIKTANGLYYSTESVVHQYRLRENNELINKADFKIKKFADKLKQIASLILGIPVEDFEKEEVKNRVLGEEWTRWYYIGGYAGNEFYKKKMTPYFYSEVEAYGYKESNKAFSLSLQEGELIKEIPTVRQFLQELGTEAIRNTIHVNAWVNALMADYEPLDLRTMQDPDDSNINYPNWIITDVRFPNELAVVGGKGFSIRINRLADIGAVNDLHPSEIALDNAKFDYTIENNGTIEELVEKVKEILIKEKIL